MFRFVDGPVVASAAFVDDVNTRLGDPCTMQMARQAQTIDDLRGQVASLSNALLACTNNDANNTIAGLRAQLATCQGSIASCRQDYGTCTVNFTTLGGQSSQTLASTWDRLNACLASNVDLAAKNAEMRKCCSDRDNIVDVMERQTVDLAAAIDACPRQAPAFSGARDWTDVVDAVNAAGDRCPA